MGNLWENGSLCCYVCGLCRHYAVNMPSLCRQYIHVILKLSLHEFSWIIKVYYSFTFHLTYNIMNFLQIPLVEGFCEQS